MAHFGLRISRPILRRPTITRLRTYHDRRLRSEGTANVVVGATVATCVTLFVYKEYASEQLRKFHNTKPWQFIEKNLVGSAQNLEQGRYWTLITYTLTHLDLGHLAFNMLGLWTFGRTVMVLYGLPGFTALWIGSGICGALATMVGQKEGKGLTTSVVGASGSVLGMSAAVACQFPKSKMYIIPIVSKMITSPCRSTATKLNQYKPFPVSSWIVTLGFAAWSVYAQNSGIGWNIGLGSGGT